MTNICAARIRASRTLASGGKGRGGAASGMPKARAAPCAPTEASARAAAEPRALRERGRRPSPGRGWRASAAATGRRTQASPALRRGRARSARPLRRARRCALAKACGSKAKKAPAAGRRSDGEAGEAPGTRQASPAPKPTAPAERRRRPPVMASITPPAAQAGPQGARRGRRAQCSPTATAPTSAAAENRFDPTTGAMIVVAADRPAKVVSAPAAKIARPDRSRIGQDGKRVAMRSLGQVAPKRRASGRTTIAPIAAPDGDRLSTPVPGSGRAAGKRERQRRPRSPRRPARRSVARRFAAPRDRS